MKILAFDTSTNDLFITLVEDGKILAGKHLSTSSTHMKNLLPLIDVVLEEAALPVEAIDYYASSVGPGSYTGLRIGVSTAQALAYAQKKECIALNTLNLCAYDRHASGLSGLVLAILDARNRRVYAKVFRGEEEVMDTKITTIDEVSAFLASQRKEGESITFVGDEKALAYAEDGEVLKLLGDVKRTEHPLYDLTALAKHSYALAKEGRVVAAQALLPNYYQATEAERNAKFFVGENENTNS